MLEDEKEAKSNKAARTLRRWAWQKFEPSQTPRGYVDTFQVQGTAMKKQVVYMHKGQQIKHVVDMDDEVVIPDKDAVIVLEGKRYKVLTGPQSTTGPAGALPVYTVYLEEI